MLICADAAEDIPATFLLYTNAKLGQVRAVDIMRDRDVMVPIIDVGRPVAIDYLLDKEEIYFSDTQSGKIKKRHLQPSSGISDVISGMSAQRQSLQSEARAVSCFV